MIGAHLPGELSAVIVRNKGASRNFRRRGSMETTRREVVVTANGPTSAGYKFYTD